jgi:hypothetical protein
MSITKEKINEIGFILSKGINTEYVDVVKILYLMYGSMYACTSLKHNTWYELRNNKWYETEEGIDLRKKISKELAIEYSRYRTFCIKIAEACMDDNTPEDLGYDISDNSMELYERSSETWLNMASNCDDVIIKLKSKPYKDRLMKEAKKLFYNEKLIKELNELKSIKSSFEFNIINNNIIISNISKYSISFDNNNLILEYKEYKDDKYLSEKDFLSQDLKYSTLQKYCINNIYFKRLKYKSFLIELYKIINCQDLISNSTMNIEKGNRYDCGYIYYKDLGFSVQGKDTIGTLTEIIHISKKYNVNINIEILLQNEKIIKYRSE